MNTAKNKAEEFFLMRSPSICLALRNQLVNDMRQASNRHVLLTDKVFQAALDTLDPEFPNFEDVDLETAIRAYCRAHDMIY